MSDERVEMLMLLSACSVMMLLSVYQLTQEMLSSEVSFGGLHYSELLHMLRYVPPPHQAAHSELTL